MDWIETDFSELSIKELQRLILRTKANIKQAEKYVNELTQEILDRELGI